MHALAATVENTPSIEVRSGFDAEELVTDGDRVVGIACAKYRHRRGRHIICKRRGAGDRRHRSAVCRHHQSIRGARHRLGYGRPGWRGDCRPRIRPVSPDRHRHRRRSRAARRPKPCAAKAQHWSTTAASVSCSGFTPTPNSRRAILSPARSLRKSRPARKAFLDARTAVGSAFAEKFPSVYATCMSARHRPRARSHSRSRRRSTITWAA